MIGIEVVITQGLFKLCLAVLGIIVGRITLMWMDAKYVGKNTVFSKWAERASDKDLAIYFAARLMFAAVIIAGAIS